MDLRQSVNKVQEIGDKVAYQAMNVGLLELRRDEKDFMLRKDISYVDKLDKNTQENAKTSENMRLIAEKTNKLAIKALKATDNKKFEGKEEIVAKNKY